MNTQTLQAVLDDRSPALSIRDAWTNCSRQNCCARIQKIEKQLAKFPRDSSLLNSYQSRLNYAKRFFESEEYGGCEYELRVAELMIAEI